MNLDLWIPKPLKTRAIRTCSMKKHLLFRDHLQCHATGAPAQMVRKATRVERTSAKGTLLVKSWLKSWLKSWDFLFILPKMEFHCHIMSFLPRIDRSDQASATLDFLVCLTCPQTLGSRLGSFTYSLCMGLSRKMG